MMTFEDDINHYLQNLGVKLPWSEFKKELYRRKAACEIAEDITIHHPLFKKLVEECAC